MSDWQGNVLYQQTLSVSDNHSGGAAADMNESGAALSVGTVWPTANLVIYVPVVVLAPITAYQMGIRVVTQSGNLDIGIYDEMGNRLVSAGSTAVAVAGVQAVNITDTPLTPGVYFLALCIDNTTASVGSTGVPTALQLQTFGIQQQALGSVTLPNPATFANPANAYVPMIFASTMQSTI